MKKALLVIVALVVVAGGGIALYLHSQKDKSSDVSVKDVAEGAKKDTQTKLDPGLRPAPGTYDYAGGGTDHVTTLGGSSHTFPRHIGVVVTLKGTGCEWNLHFVYVKEKTKDRHMCTDEHGARELGSRETVQFFGITDDQKFTCEDPGGLRVPFDAMAFQPVDKASPATGKPGSKWHALCSTPDRDVAHVVTLVDTKPLTVGGKSVPAWHTHDVSTLTGASKGSDDTSFWWARTGLPLRIIETTAIKTKSAIGDTNYTVQATYNLTSMEPS